MEYTNNYLKHLSRNPLQIFLINRFYQKLISVSSQINPKKILDVGCGEGFTLERFRRANIGTGNIGVDNSSLALKLGRKLHPDLNLIKGDIFKISYQGNSFDLVVCSEVLEHLKKPRKALREIIRVSSKYCLITVPREPFFMMANFLRGKNIPRLGNDPGHIQHWTKKRFLGLIKSSGLKIKVLTASFPWLIILAEKK